MRFTQVKLVNFRQHEDLTVDFSPQMTAICGRNGCGKSNLLQALRFALFGGYRGGRASEIRQGKPMGVSAYVELHIEHHESIVVRRWLEPVDMTLHIGGEKIEGTPTKLSAELQSCIGANKHLDEYIFIRQRKIAAMFTETAAARSERLSSLFGVAHAGVLWEKLGKFIGNIGIPVFARDVVELRRLHDKEQAQLERSTADLAQYGWVVDDMAEYERKRHTIIADAKTRELLESDVGKLQIAIKQAEDAKELRQKTWQDLLVDRTELAKEKEEHGSAVAMAEKLLVQWRDYTRAEGLRTTIRLGMADFFEQWQKRVRRPVGPRGANAREEVAEALRMKEAPVAALRWTLGALKDSATRNQTAKCPVCSNPVNFVEIAGKLMQRLAPEEALLNEALAHKFKLDEYDKNTAAYRRECAQFKLQAQRLRDLRDNTIAVEEPVVPIELCNQAVSMQRELAAKLERIEKELASASPVHSHKLLDNLVDQLRDKETALNNLSYAGADLAKAAKDELNSMSAGYRDRTAATYAVSLSSDRLKDLQKELASVKEIETVSARKIWARDLLIEVRDMLHRSNAPAAVSHSRLGSLVTEINHNLDMFDIDFRIRTTDDRLTFDAIFADGTVMPDDRLSVGEQIALAMSFWMALNMTLLDIGVLVMDEPTAGLDSFNMRRMSDVFRRMQEISAARNLQLIVITHEQIAHHFDHVVRLDE